MDTRTLDLIGPENAQKINALHILIVGLGGVGSFTVEALARSGVSQFTLVDKDTVDQSNINRQLPALHSTIDQAKVDVLKKRILDINPNATVQTYHSFYSMETKEDILGHSFDYICDCIDTITFKIDLIDEAFKRNVPIISVLGTGNKLDPTLLEVTRLNKTSHCPIARILRKKLMHISSRVEVIYSKEPQTKYHHEKRTPASMVFVPSSAGILAASTIIRHVLQK